MTISEIIELGTVDVTNNSRCWFGDDCENCSDNDPDPNAECYDAPTESPICPDCADHSDCNNDC